MAALYLHQALFAPESSAPPVLVHASPAVGPNDRRLSTFSTVTLHTASNSDHSHPTESLLYPQESESANAYLDLLARQPPHPSSPLGAASNVLSLEGDPVTPSERRSHWERRVRRKLRRLRWVRAVLLAIIVGWSTYNTIRYYLAFALYPYRTRQIILLALGTCAALSITLVTASLLLSLFAPRLGWLYRPGAPHVVCQTILIYSSSALLLSPAIVNFVFVFLWRHTSNTPLSLAGRCHWDIDVFWTGIGDQCGNRAPAWAYWLAGAVTRVVLTFMFVVAYHVTCYFYDITRRPLRRRRRSHRSVPSTAGTTTSTRSLKPEISGISLPVTPVSPVSSTSPVLSLSHIGRQPSITTSEGHTAESYGSSADSHRPLRSSRVRIVSQSHIASKSWDALQTPSPSSPSTVQEKTREKDSSFATTEQIADHDSESSSSFEDLSLSPYDCDRYGSQVRRVPDTYSAIPPGQHVAGGEDTPCGSPYTDSELNTFVDRFRSLVDQISCETEEGIALAQNDRPGFYVTNPDSPSPSPSPTHETNIDDDYVPVLGRTVHRMPTIESLGSREVMSILSVAASGSSVHRASPGPHHLSRPSTRSNTFSLSEAGTSTPSTRSRANSLDAALALASPVGERFTESDEDADGDADAEGVDEDEYVTAPTASHSHPSSASVSAREGGTGTGSSASYRSAKCSFPDDYYATDGG